MGSVQECVKERGFYLASNRAQTASEATSNSTSQANSGVPLGAISPSPNGMHQYVWHLVKLIFSHLKNG